MTIILTLVGLVVMFISCFTVGFKSAMKRLGMFALTGFVIDVLLATLAGTALYLLLK